jgi:hypothetical protein
MARASGPLIHAITPAPGGTGQEMETMKLYDSKGRIMRLAPPPRPADDAQPIGWVDGLAVWGVVSALWAHGETLSGFVTPADRAAVWATGMENWDGHTWDVPHVADVPLNWREIAAEYAAKQAAENAAWQAGEAARAAADADRKARAAAEAAAKAPSRAPEYHGKWGDFSRGESGRWDRHED